MPASARRLGSTDGELRPGHGGGVEGVQVIEERLEKFIRTCLEPISDASSEVKKCPRPTMQAAFTPENSYEITGGGYEITGEM